MKDYFISYTSADVDYATWIAEKLEEAGKTVTIQAWDFLPGANFVAEINKALIECEKIIVVMSKRYLESQWCREEWTSGLAQKDALENRRIIPIRIEPVEVSGLLSPIVYIDLVGKSENEAHKLILDNLVGKRARKCNGFPKIEKDNSIEKKAASVPPTQSEIDKTKELNAFNNKLYNLYEKDGMMKCFYRLFVNLSLDEFNEDEIKLLSIVQDEYQKIYDQYNINRKVTDSSGFDRIINNKKVKELESNSKTNSLIITYLHFVKGDQMYFIRKYDKAIEYYQDALAEIENTYNEKEMSADDECRCVYLMNSIAWSYRLRENEGDNLKAIDTYKQLFKKYKNADTYTFSSTYRRNYGVVLEREKKYTEALVQYKKALKCPLNNISRSTLFITYCTVMMKYWDQETGKLSGSWIKRTRQLRNDTCAFMSDKIFLTIDSHLNFAEKEAPKHLLPNVHIQRAKLLTYKMILADNAANRNKIIDAIEEELILLESFSTESPGWHYINRDYYYALFELTRTLEKKEEYYQKAWDENEEIKQFENKGDSAEFSEMLLKRKSKKIKE